MTDWLTYWPLWMTRHSIIDREFNCDQPSIYLKKKSLQSSDRQPWAALFSQGSACAGSRVLIGQDILEGTITPSKFRLAQWITGDCRVYTGFLQIMTYKRLTLLIHWNSGEESSLQIKSDSLHIGNEYIFQHYYAYYALSPREISLLGTNILPLSQTSSSLSPLKLWGYLLQPSTHNTTALIEFLAQYSLNLATASHQLGSTSKVLVGQMTPFSKFSSVLSNNPSSPSTRTPVGFSNMAKSCQKNYF